MKTAVITGGTDGIGRALANTYLRRGFRVVVIGRNTAKGQAFLDAAATIGAEGRSGFLTADLSLVGDTTRLIEELTDRLPRIDVLVLGARYHRSIRSETAEGFESNFALSYLSRFLLSHGLIGPLEQAERPVVVNFAASGQAGPVQWDDLQLERRYHGAGALGHSGRLNDLLGVSFVDVRPTSPVRYVLNHPGVVSTSFAGEYDSATAAQVEIMRRSGKSVGRSVADILPFLDSARPERLTAVLEGKRIPVDTGLFDSADAARLHRLTETLLAEANSGT